MKGYLDCPLEEAESLRQLDKTIEGIIVKATILTETEKLWRREGQISPQEVYKAYQEMEAKIDEVL